VHVLNWTEPQLIVPLKRKIVRATLLSSGAAVAVKRQPSGIELSLPTAALSQIDTVVKLHLSR
jgi:hypothetical protein